MCVHGSVPATLGCFRLPSFGFLWATSFTKHLSCGVVHCVHNCHHEMYANDDNVFIDQWCGYWQYTDDSADVDVNGATAGLPAMGNLVVGRDRRGFVDQCLVDMRSWLMRVICVVCDVL